MTLLDKEQTRRLRRAWRDVSRTTRAVRKARGAFIKRPGLHSLRMWAALPNADDLRVEVVRAVRPLDRTLAVRMDQRFREAVEAEEYASAAIDLRSWDAALVDVDRVMTALIEIETTLRRELPIHRPLWWL